MLKNILILVTLTLITSSIRVQHLVQDTLTQNLTDSGQQIKKQFEQKFDTITQNITNKISQKQKQLVNTTNETTNTIQNTTQSTNNEVKETINQTKQAIENETQGITQTTQNKTQQIQETTNQIKEAIKNATQGITENTKNATQELKNTTNEIKQTIKNATQGITENTKNATQELTNKTNEIKQTIKNATEGIINKPVATPSQQEKKLKEQGGKFIQQKISKLKGLPINNFIKQGDNLSYKYVKDAVSYEVQLEEIKQENKPIKYKLIGVQQTNTTNPHEKNKVTLSEIGSFEEAVKELNWN